MTKRKVYKELISRNIKEKQRMRTSTKIALAAMLGVNILNFPASCAINKDLERAAERYSPHGPGVSGTEMTYLIIPAFTILGIAYVAKNARENERSN